MAGVRALVRKEGVRESDVSRRHALFDHAARGGPAGLLSILGGKITGYREIARDAVDAASRKLAHLATCTTAQRPLPGASSDPIGLESKLAAACGRLGLEAQLPGYLIARYGQRAGGVLALADKRPELRQRADPRQITILAEVVFAATDEAAVSLSDVFLRRTALGLAPGHGLESARRVAETLAPVLGWNNTEQAAQVQVYRDQIDSLYALPREPAPAAL